MKESTTDKFLRVTKKTHEIFRELKYKTEDSVRSLVEEAALDLKKKRLNKKK